MTKKFKLSYKSYTIKLKYTFAISSSTRNVTPSVQTELEYDGIVGYGEASLPPYLAESQQSVIHFLSKIDLNEFNDPFQIEEILRYIDSVEDGNNAAKASVDIALHDLVGKINNLPLYKYFGLNKPKDTFTSYSIGLDSDEMISRKLIEARGFKFLKVKLGSSRDKEVIEVIRSKNSHPLYVDVNQGWKDKYEALKMIEWLADKNVLLIEQPLPKENIDDIAWLSSNSPLPIIADESVQRLNDIEKVKDIYSGINIKLMKSTGLHEAFRMMKKAKETGLKIMLGCMIETSCAVSAAAHLTSLADWIDLDGPLLIENDNFIGLSYIDGEIKISDLAGIGVRKVQNIV